MTEPSPVYIVTSQEQARTAPHSIQLSLNAKHEYQWEIKLYFATGEEEHTVELLQVIDGVLRQMFLPPSPGLEQELAASIPPGYKR